MTCFRYGEIDSEDKTTEKYIDGGRKMPDWNGRRQKQKDASWKIWSKPEDMVISKT